jgi:squalene-hopene/tetraprenyl-beta-curcumene cyclase
MREGESMPIRYALCVLALAFPTSLLANDGVPPDWKPVTAAQYLDTRAKTWSEFTGASRGAEATHTSCICCHTVVPIALARPILRTRLKETSRSEFEGWFFKERAMRVDAWAKLDSPAYQLLYDSSDDKKRESRGTEAVLNALVLAFEDHYRGLKSPSDVAKKAFTNLWDLQVESGPNAGSWEWLNFGTEPWESKQARYHGASLAAIAIGTCPDYYKKGVDPTLDAKVKLLAKYLKENLAAQNTFNKIWCLWAAVLIDEIIPAQGREQIIADLFSKQLPDGGWSLSSLGSFTRKDGTQLEVGSDGYATGLILHVLQTAGVSKEEARVARGLAWLRANQKSGGEWRASSLNKKRDPESHTGKFMADAATAFAVLALSH